MIKETTGGAPTYAGGAGGAAPRVVGNEGVGGVTPPNRVGEWGGLPPPNRGGNVVEWGVGGVPPPTEIVSLRSLSLKVPLNLCLDFLNRGDFWPLQRPWHYAIRDERSLNPPGHLGGAGKTFLFPP